MEPASNPFHNPSKGRSVKDGLVRVFFMVLTYAILLFTLTIFGLFIKRGVPVLSQYGWEFIKRNPESLELMTFDAAEKLEIPASSFQTLLTYNPQEGLFTDIQDTTKTDEFRKFKIEPGSVIGDGYLSSVEGYNDFSAKYLKRDLEAEVSFELPKDTTFVLKPEVYQEVIKKSEKLKALPHDVLDLSKKKFKVNFKEQEGVLQAKTISVLSSSSLIYKLYGNLADAEDSPDENIPLYIPRDQTILLTPDQHSAYQSDQGTIKSAPAEEITEQYQLIKISIEKGQHTLPLSSLAMLQKETPAASVIHSHNLDKGAIHLDLKETTDEFLLPVEEFEKMVADNPALKVSSISNYTHETDYKQFTLTKAIDMKLPTEDMTALRASTGTEFNLPRLKPLSEKVFPYSAGGIAGPILGTAALVLACMIIALAIGVCAAIFLGEYSKKEGSSS